jgi:hypothetical protein
MATASEQPEDTITADTHAPMGSNDGKGSPKRQLTRHASLFLEDPEPIPPKVVMVRLNPKAEANIPLPPDPYNEHTNIDDGISCYIPGCTCTKPFDAYGNLLQHLKSYHCVKLSDLHGAYTHSQGTKDFNKKQVDRTKKRDAVASESVATKKQKAERLKLEPKASSKHAKAEPEAAARQVKLEPKAAVEQSKPEPNARDEVLPLKEDPTSDAQPEDDRDETSLLEPEPFKWIAMPCWIKCHMQGTPITPLQCNGLVQRDFRACAPTSLPKRGQTSLLDHYNFPPKGDALNMAPPPKHVDATQQLQLFQVTADIIDPSTLKRHYEIAPISQRDTRDQVCLSSSSTELVPQYNQYNKVRPEAALQMVTEMYHGFKNKEFEEVQAKQWKDRVPNVGIKQNYIEQEAPAAKREEKTGRAMWPKKLKSDQVGVSDFRKYLVHLNLGEAQTSVIVKGAGRALGMLRVSDDTPITDVKILVGFFLGEAYDQLVGLRLLHPKYFWTADLLEGFGAYINYMNWKLKRMRLREGDDADLTKYQDCLDLLITSLKSGHMKRCRDEREKSFRVKGKEDLYVLKNFPDIEISIKPCVKDALLALKKIGEEYIGKSNMPSRILSFANEIICGVWEYITFLGRKWEIEHCTEENMKKVLIECMEYLLCSQHKTCKTYGDVIKFIPPALWKALQIYDLFPKPKSEYFLVPVTPTAKTISFPSLLRSFNKRFLRPRMPPSHKQVSPTCNQVRKLFHKQLMALTKNEAKMKDMMTQLDAHGRSVQDKHYLIRDPEDDLALAKLLVNSVLGETVPWPEDDTSLEKDLEDLLAEIEVGAEDDGASHADEEDDEPLEHWAFAASFGIRAPGELNVVPLADFEAAEAHASPENSADEKKSKEDKANDKKSNSGNDKNEASDRAPACGAVGGATTTTVPEEHQGDLYRDYPYEKSPTSKKSSISPETHDYIYKHILTWQEKHGQGELERPQKNYWYYNLRIKLIDEGYLTKQHCLDAARNSCKAQLEALAKTRCEDVD